MYRSADRVIAHPAGDGSGARSRAVPVTAVAAYPTVSSRTASDDRRVASRGPTHAGVGRLERRTYRTRAGA